MRGEKLEGDLPEGDFIASPKIDGLRAYVYRGVVLSKTGKPIPNLYVQELFSQCEGLDGELTIGPPHKQHPDDDVYKRSRGILMRKSNEPVQAYFNIFDRIDCPSDPAETRIHSLVEARDQLIASVDWTDRPGTMHLVPQVLVNGQEHFLQLEEWALSAGYEGLMLRGRDAGYKYGQATLRQGNLIKVKRFEDAEALILGVVERQTNTNEAYLDEVGYTRRSSAKDGKVGLGTLGAFLVRDVKTGVEFSIGTGKGLTDSVRRRLWQQRQDLPGRYVRYVYQGYGTDAAPRCPIWTGFRDALDLSDLEVSA